MKLLKLQFNNLNSFTGNWEIDFTDPHYQANGIFAITGPTGSGKSTILDAIALALYRRTPRLGDITGSTNDIMSRHTGECGAEVEFKTQDGHYRATFLQHRARRQPGGDLQGYTHELVDVKTGKSVLEKSATAAEIERYTGMDFSRFTRSIMLAQGSFDAFLRAKPDERSPILEQITGTTFYAEISTHVHILKTEQDKALDALMRDAERVDLLSPDDETALKESLAELEKNERNLKASLKSLKEKTDWWTTLDRLAKRISASDAAVAEFEKKRNAFAADLKRLDRADKALLLSKDDAGLLSARSQLANLNDEKSSAESAIPALQKAVDDANSATTVARDAVASAKKEREGILPVLKQVRTLDQDIANLSKTVAQWGEAVTSATSELSNYDTQIADATTSLNAITAELSDVDTYLNDHDNDQLLQKNFSMIRRDFDQLKQHKNTQGQIMDYLKKAQAKEASAKNDLDELKVVSTDILSRKQTAEDTLKQARSDLDTVLGGKKPAVLQAELDALRSKDASLSGAADLIKRTINAAEERDALSAQVKELKTVIDDQNTAIHELTTLRDTCNTAVESLINDLSTAGRQADLNELRDTLVENEPCPLCGSKEHPYAHETPPKSRQRDGELQETRDELSKHVEALKAMEIAQIQSSGELKQMEAKIAELADEHARCTTSWKGILQSLNLDSESADPLKLAEQEITSLAAQREKLSGNLASREDREADLKSAQAALDTIQDENSQLITAEQEARDTLTKASADVERFESQFNETTESFDRLTGECLARVAPFGITEISIPTLDDSRMQLTKRLKTWQEMNSNKQTLQRRKQTTDAELQKHRALRDSVAKTLADAESKRDEADTEYSQHKLKRQELLGDRNADDEETRLEGLLAKALETEEARKSEHAVHTNSLNDTQALIARLTKKIQQANSERQKCEDLFAARLKTSAFTSEQDYREACLSDDDRKALRQQADELTNTGAKLSAVLQEQKNELESEKARKLTDQPLAALLDDMDAHESMNKDLRNEIGSIMAKLAGNDANRKTYDALHTRIKAQQKECSGWAKLHALIGSSDGKKYRNFAQGLTFDIVISHANKQLRKMTDRYLLVKNEDDPLELDVVDNYQGGDIRTTKNLSGGESFIVSLALALGLSNMSSKNIRVDTMFLDEGFGTLDEDALDTALEALAELHEDGKLIGVISHVPALKERISTQLQVVPIAGGRSQLIGPGVT